MKSEFSKSDSKHSGFPFGFAHMHVGLNGLVPKMDFLLCLHKRKQCAVHELTATVSNSWYVHSTDIRYLPCPGTLPKWSKERASSLAQAVDFRNARRKNSAHQGKQEIRWEGRKEGRFKWSDTWLVLTSLVWALEKHGKVEKHGKFKNTESCSSSALGQGSLV